MKYNIPASPSQKRFIKELAKKNGLGTNIESIMFKLGVQNYSQGGISKVEAMEVITRLKKINGKLF